MKRLVLVCVCVLAVALLAAGCKSSSTAGTGRADSDYVVVEKVQKLDQNPLPDWVMTPRKYKDAKADCDYFVGIGFPRQTLAFAMNSAAEDAYMKIAKYIGQVVATKAQRAGEAKNVHGQQSIETVVEQLVQKTVAIAKVKNAKLEESYADRVVALHGGVGVEMYQVYQLYGVPRPDLVATGHEAGKAAADELQKERDEIRKEQLQKLEELLKGLTKDDFGI